MTVELIEGGITAPKGFLAAGIHCGIKKSGRRDISIVYSERPAVAVGAFTTNLVKAAPVSLTEGMLNIAPYLQAVVINSGNANAMTGGQGMADAEAMGNSAADALGISPGLVAVASTGVIGRYLPMEPITRGIRDATKALARGPAASADAAEGMMTTDTFRKEIAVRTRLADGTMVTVAGMAKGSGMIAPAMRLNHATMLCFITTDACVGPGALARLFSPSLERSFNMINVDGDQSTNDMVLVMANGAAGNEPFDEDPAFAEALEHVCTSLAKMIVKDGEGATKLFEVTVTGAVSEQEGRSAAISVVRSNLVKAAIFGCDPNFGRIAAALGRAGCALDPGRLEVGLASSEGSALIIENGLPVGMSDPAGLQNARRILQSPELNITIDLGLGSHTARAWGCDLTYDYVKINAEYTT
jgi:glutamate N-acetyltransferase/amino-acid N-acetyltransferase